MSQTSECEKTCQVLYSCPPNFVCSAAENSEFGYKAAHGGMLKPKNGWRNLEQKRAVESFYAYLEDNDSILMFTTRHKMETKNFILILLLSFVSSSKCGKNQTKI